MSFVSANDTDALEAFSFLSRTEGIFPALESAHATAGAICVAKELEPEKDVVVCLSRRRG